MHASDPLTMPEFQLDNKRERFPCMKLLLDRLARPAVATVHFKLVDSGNRRDMQRKVLEGAIP